MFIIHKLSLLANRLLAITRPIKQLIVLTLDTTLCALSVATSFYLLLEEFSVLSGAKTFSVQITFAVSVALTIPIFFISGLYRTIFRYNGMLAMMTIARAMFIYAAVYSAIFTFIGVTGVPRTIGLIQPIVLFMLVGVTRVTARIWLGDLYQQKLKRHSIPKVLIYGAGSAGRQLAFAMSNNQEMQVVGFMDDDDRLHGHTLNGLTIHKPSDVENIACQKNVSTVLLALPSISRERRNQILASLSKAKVSVRTLPKLSDIVSGKVTFSDVKELDIDDLLGREPVKPDWLLISGNNHNKTILVTGAGGSIGSELCRQLIMTQPRHLLLVEISEFALYSIHRELQSISELREITKYKRIEIVPLLASVCDEVLMNRIMNTWKPQTVYHAAAYKHVPLVEHNQAVGVHNNVWGTKVCAEVAVGSNVQNFVLVSTDKAVRPTNIMGASKRLAELVIQAISSTDISTCFSIVRFGNVLGSSGSVVPLFRQQIKSGGPITLTNSEITRYFMTVSEAAQLVIQAGAMDSKGDVFVLDMGEPIRIRDLAIRMVELSGLAIRDERNPLGEIEIKITGLRPGEKLYEELLIGDNPKRTQHPRIMKAQEGFIPLVQLKEHLQSLALALNANDVTMIRILLKQIVSGYQPKEYLFDWVYMEKERQAGDK